MSKSALKAPESPFSGGRAYSNLVLGTLETAKLASKEAFSGFNEKNVPTPVPKKRSAYRKRFLKNYAPYKLPKIVRAKGDWFIKYFYEIPGRPGKFKEFRVRDGINFIHDPEEKEAEVKKLCEDIRYALEFDNHNPFEERESVKAHVEDKQEQIRKRSERKDWTLSEAIKRYRAYITTKGLAVRTVNTYNSCLYLLEKHLAANPEKNVLAQNFTEYDLSVFMEEVGKNWTARTYNNFAKFYVTFINRCYRLERMTNRYVHYDFHPEEISFKKEKAQRNKAFSRSIRLAIKKEAGSKGYLDLQDFLEWIYLSSMRPAEVRELQFKDVDTFLRQIRIMGKTGDRLIPISDQLLKLIEKRSHLSKDHNDYIFGMAGKVGPQRMSKDYFPSQFAQVKEALGLDHRYTIYSMKATGIQDMIKAGFKDEEIRMLTGHKTQAAFEAYKRDLVIDNSHVMKHSTIDF